ncbi:MAG: acetylxylan esterase [Mangrovibacterium sp.]
MKKFILLCVALIGFSSINAQIKGDEITVMVSPNHQDWNYKLGEKCQFSVQVFKAQNLLHDVSISYELGAEFYPDLKKENVTVTSGTIELSHKGLNTPGFIRCKVTATVGEKNYYGSATVGYAADKLSPITTQPDDFNQFWANTLKEARYTELRPTRRLLPERCTDKVDVYEVSFHNIRWGSRTYGILAIPRATGKYPALLRVPGAGVRPYYGDVQTAEKGAIVLEIGIHGIPVTMPQSTYDELASGALNGYWDFNRDNKDENYYKRVVVGAVRAVDYICSLPEYNGESLGVTGSSQGGALSVMTAALDKRVTFLAAVHPAMCDHLAHTQGRAGGWPHWFYYDQNYTKAQQDVSRYYDTTNFARNLTVSGWYSWGYNDDVCPPTSMHATYNIITAPKELHLYLQTAHFWYQEQWDEWCNWIWNQLGI